MYRKTLLCLSFTLIALSACETQSTAAAKSKPSGAKYSKTNPDSVFILDALPTWANATVGTVQAENIKSPIDIAVYRRLQVLAARMGADAIVVDTPFAATPDAETLKSRVTLSAKAIVRVPEPVPQPTPQLPLAAPPSGEMLPEPVPSTIPQGPASSGPAPQPMFATPTAQVL